MRTLLLASLLSLSTILSAPIVAQSSATKLTVDGVSHDVTVRRDVRGIPYIEAANDADLYFAQGYVTASDRLWQMDMMRRVVRGETAELFGKAALEQDKRWRRFGFARVVDASYATLAPELKAALDSYTRGVNAYIASLDETTTSIEFKLLQYKPSQWKPTDSLWWRMSWPISGESLTSSSVGR